MTDRFEPVYVDVDQDDFDDDLTPLDPERRFFLDDEMFAEWYQPKDREVYPEDPETGEPDLAAEPTIVHPDPVKIYRPHFSVQEVAKIFFAKSPDWLRWRSRGAEGYPDGYFVLDPNDPAKRTKLEPKRTDAGARYYTLADVEKMLHAAYQNGAIEGFELAAGIYIVKWMARLHGKLD